MVALRSILYVHVCRHGADIRKIGNNRLWLQQVVFSEVLAGPVDDIVVVADAFKVNDFLPLLAMG